MQFSVPLLLLLLVVTRANAYTFEPSTWPVSVIHGLQVGGQLMDVTFAWSALDNLTNPEQALYWHTQADALVAADAINAALNDSNMPIVERLQLGDYYMVAYDQQIVPGYVLATGVLSRNPAAFNYVAQWAVVNQSYSVTSMVYTLWQPTDVPVPSAAWLLPSALAALPYARRRILFSSRTKKHGHPEKI